ncbi:MAG TPA: tetratricopeptide repeat protein [Verrucomicrobiae bacterium]
MNLQRKKGDPVLRSRAVGTPPAPPEESGNGWMILLVCVFLALITFVVFGQTARFEFINYDDGPYVYLNPIVSAGLTFKGIAAIFSHYQIGDWVPLTMVSHMLDCQIYGLNAGGHHLTNVLLHTASSIILFLTLRRMTGALWRSAVAAAVFAIHPLHVESVAWVAERKDVLSGLFFMLTLWAYAGYVRKPGSLAKYLMVMFWFALGLMSKGSLMMVPFLLLLLDYWPLNRFSNSPPARLIIEKIPLLGLSIVFGIIAVLAQSHAPSPGIQYPLTMRIENALFFLVIYAGQLFHPANLAAFYPIPAKGYSLFEVFGAVMVLAAFSLAAFFWRRKRPYLLAGWLWYLVMLVPVIGVIQVGYQTRADRYTYLPEIGLGLLVVWLVAELSARLRHGRAILGIGAALILVALMVSARIQTSFWRDSGSLWSHAIASTGDNSIAQFNLGAFLIQTGDLDDATHHLQSALEIDPRFAAAYDSLGNISVMQGQADQALVCYRKALEINPNNAEIENNIGLVYARKWQVDEAIRHFQKAVAIDPDYQHARYDLQMALLQKQQETNAPGLGPDSAAPTTNLPSQP